MTREEAQALVNNHNEEIREFMEHKLPALLNKSSADDKINFHEWILANKLFEEQGFYEKGRDLQKRLQAEGYQVRMNMQSEELVW